jgi:multidrug efflux pump subunit AcrB
LVPKSGDDADFADDESDVPVHCSIVYFICLTENSMPQSRYIGSSRERFNISRWAIAYPQLTIGFWLAVVVAGIFAFSTLKLALFPDITFPVVIVRASAPIETALATEAQLTQPIEGRIQSMPGLENLQATIYPGQTAVSLAFAVGTPLEATRQQVETQVKSLKLPSGSSLEVLSLNLNESAIVSYAVQSNQNSLAQLSQIAQQQILPAIQRIPGVLKVTLLGAPTDTITNQSIVRFNTQEVLAIEVVKRGEANTLDVVSQVEQQVQALRGDLPHISFTLAATQANYIHEATQATIESLAIAIVLAILVIFPFLNNWRATLISALAIPTALCGTFIVMAGFGFNLETITLLALALVVGIIVDDAIVDVENIARHLETGETARQAAITATNEIGLTVTAATLTIVAVFLPVGLMGGVVGQFFKPFGVTVSAAVLVSLLVARTLSPLLAMHWLKPEAQRLPALHWDVLLKGYHRLLSWSLRHRGWVISLAILSLVMGLSLIPWVPKGFIPKLDRGEFNLVYTTTMPPMAAAELEQAQQAHPEFKPETLVQQKALQQSGQTAQQLESVVKAQPSVQAVFTQIGALPGEPHKGKLYIKLKDDRTQSTAQVQAQIRQQLPTLAGVAVQVEDIQFVDTGNEAPLQVALRGDDLKVLAEAANTIKLEAEKLTDIVAVTASGAVPSVVPSVSGMTTIEHLNSQRVAYVRAHLSQKANLGEATDQLVAIAQKHLPPGVTLDLGGDSAQANEVFNSFSRTLLLSVLCIIAVLTLLFRNWIDPLIIVLALPLSLVGAMVMLVLTQSDFGMISVIGIIFLLGLTNKNAILIVDYINQLRQSGYSCTEAILIAAPIRLRPILMTTAATILGMLPIALGLGAGSELRAPMAITIMGGLMTSTILSLVVVPVVYSSLDDLRLRGRGRLAN